MEFRRQARAGMKRVLGPHTPERYASAATFRIYEHNAIPGLFQTAAYCAAMLSFWMEFLGTTDQLDAAVGERMKKQEVLQRPGKHFHVVLEEQALRTWFGAAEIHAGQLGRLLEVMALPSVSLGIIPMMAERSGVASAPFWIFDKALVALETPSAAIEVTRPEEIAVYTRMFAHLEAAALRGPDARALIVKALDEMS